MLDWDDFKDLDTVNPVPITLNEQQQQLLLTAMSFLEVEEFKNDIPDDRDAVISGVIDALSG